MYATGRPNYLEGKLDPGMELLALPATCCTPTSREQMLTYSCILRCHGYSSPDLLMKRVSEWRNAIKQSCPDLVIADHSPTALLAARLEQVPSATIGIGFYIPPRVYPLPHLQWWKPSPGRARLRRLERQVHESINSVLRNSNAEEMSQVSELFDIPLRALITVPLLDDYVNRPEGDKYYGVYDKAGDGVWNGWPDRDRGQPKVFGYLRARYPSFRAIVNSLASMNVRAAIYAPDCPDDVMNEMPSHVTLSRNALDMRRGAGECDFAVSYSSNGFVSEVLAEGKPMFLAPSIVHHAMTAKRAVRVGAAALGEPSWSVSQYKHTIEQLIEDEKFVRGAEAAAQHIAQYPRGREVEERIVEESENLL